MSQIVNVHMLAEFWDVDIRTVQNYADSNYEKRPLPREARGEYDFVKAMKWMYDRQTEQIEILENAGDEKIYAAKLKGQQIKNKKEELILRRELGSLIIKRDAIMVVTNILNTLKSSLNSLKYELRTELQEVNDEEEKGTIIAKMIDDKIKTITTPEKIETYLTDDEKFIEAE